MTTPLHQRGVAALGRALAEGDCSSVELTQALLERATAQDRFGAFLATHAESALAQAREADARRARGQAGPLTGVPVAHKDIFVTDFDASGLPSTAGSKMLEGYKSPFDATVVARLGTGEVSPPGGEAPGPDRPRDCGV